MGRIKNEITPNDRSYKPVGDAVTAMSESGRIVYIAQTPGGLYVNPFSTSYTNGRPDREIEMTRNRDKAQEWADIAARWVK